MFRRSAQNDYETVSCPRSRRDDKSAVVENRKPSNSRIQSAITVGKKSAVAYSHHAAATILKRGHALSFAALFVFTIILYARPAEFYPSALTNSLALIIGAITLATFLVTQLPLEGSLTARPVEVNLVLLFVVTALLSIPLAIDPAVAWGDFGGTFIRGILIFIVIVNVVRTEARLKALLFLAIATAIFLSVGAINDYRLGLMLIEGYRASGRGTGIFGNTNDMALFLVTVLPISIAFFFGSLTLPKKVMHAACAAMMIFGILLSYSRGAFLGMVVVFVFFALQIGKRSRFEIAAVVVALTGAIILLAPSGYGARLLSIFIPGLDAEGSADSRRGELLRSLYVALRHPLLGIGMGNYQPNMSYKGLVTHNSYTQVASEMGMTALVLYTMFIVKPLRKLSVIARETFGAREKSHLYYLALGLQASLLVFMVSSFFLSVAYAWNVYYLVGYAVCFRRIYESQTGKLVVIEKRKRSKGKPPGVSIIDTEQGAATA
jgi:O-antigen ligase